MFPDNLKLNAEMKTVRENVAEEVISRKVNRSWVKILTHFCITSSVASRLKILEKNIIGE